MRAALHLRLSCLRLRKRTKERFEAFYIEDADVRNETRDNSRKRICLTSNPVCSEDNDGYRRHNCSETKSGFSQAHFSPGGNEYGCVKRLSSGARNRHTTILYSGNVTPGGRQVFLHLARVFRTNKKGLFEAKQLNSPKDSFRSAGARSSSL